MKEYKTEGHYNHERRTERIEGTFRHFPDGRIIGFLYDINSSTSTVRRNILGLATKERLSY
ncbi:MAG: hypothetical protein ISS82_02985 [Nanoarchaeota archaeon]|nr:hypothetical protein [Nanoarchaeota archaeon]